MRDIAHMRDYDAVYFRARRRDTQRTYRLIQIYSIPQALRYLETNCQILELI